MTDIYAREYYREYYIRNKEAKNQQSKEYYQQNKEKIQAKQHEYYRKNRAVIRSKRLLLNKWSRKTMEVICDCGEKVLVSCYNPEFDVHSIPGTNKYKCSNCLILGTGCSSIEEYVKKEQEQSVPLPELELWTQPPVIRSGRV